MAELLYIKMEQSVELEKPNVSISDIATLESSDRNMLNKLKTIKLLRDNTNGKNRYVISVIKILQIINQNFENVTVENLGATECVVSFKRKQTNRTGEIIKTIIVCFILFFGVGFSIMSFNNDVGVDRMFEQVSSLFGGDKKITKHLLEYCYSIGLGIGIIVFYNHFGKKKLSNDPTPIEVEMRKYELDINQTLIDENEET